MTVTIHKILVHGQEIIESNPLPVGMLSEQAAESRNKFWRRDRELHCRKMDREKTMTDLFHRALESSDPFISAIRLRRRQKLLKRLALPVAVQNLLKASADEGELIADKADLEQEYTDYLDLNDNDDTILATETNIID